MDLMRDAANKLDAIMRAYARTTVVYARGGKTASLLAGFGQTTGDVVPGSDAYASLDTREQSFVFTTQDLVAANLWPPRVDDEIRVAAVDGESPAMTFAVTSHAGEPVYRFSDEYGISARVFGVRMS